MKRLGLMGLILWLSLAASAQTPESSPVVPEPRVGSLAGRIVTDDRQPLAKVRVQINRLGVKQAEMVNAKTDAEGAFVANGLAAGAYSVSASMPGYVTANGFSANEYHRLGSSVNITLTKGGVITGRVEDETGSALVKVNVKALRLRTLQGASVVAADFDSRSTTTDDRGVYRLYGLAPGFYHVAITPGANWPNRNQLTTYHPSASRPLATEVAVPAGGEIAGIDIRLRKQLGVTVSGTASGQAETGMMSGSYVQLFNLATQTWEDYADIKPNQPFAIHGVADGDYELHAVSQNYGGEEAGYTAIAKPVRVSVRGADVTGIAVRMLPVGSIKGRVVLEKTEKPASEAPNCPATTSLIFESVVSALTEGAPKRNPWGNVDAPNEQGQFRLRGLEAGTYHLQFDWPAPHWYVRTIAGLTATVPAAGKVLPAANDQFMLKPGQALDNVIVTVAANAARLQGRVVAASAAKLPARLRVHLIPVDATQAEELLRYDEVITQGDGLFQFDHIAPGKYWLLAQAVPANEPLETQRRLQAWDSVTRKQLRQAAARAGKEISLTACQRLADISLSVSAP